MNRIVNASVGAVLAMIGSQAAWPQQDNIDLAEEYRQMDLDARTNIVKYVYVDPPRGLEASLVIINTSWREITFKLEAMTANSNWVEIAEVATEARRSFSLPIPNESLGRAKLLRISYFDLPDGIGAQLLYSSPRNQGRHETYTVPFLIASNTEEQLVAWAGENNESLSVTVVNAGADELEYEMTVNGSTHSYTVRPFETQRHRFTDASIIEVDGAATPDLLVWAHELSPSHALVELPLFDVDSLGDTAGFASTHIPNDGGQLVSLEVTLANLADSSASIPCFLIDNASGAVISAKTVSLGAGEVAKHDLMAEWGSIEDWSRYRLEAGPTSTPFIAHGTVQLPNGAQTELSLQGLTSGHGSGRYPVPGIDIADSTLNLVNLGGETALVAGKLNWDGGELLIEPIEIPSKASALVDIRSLVEGNEEVPKDFAGGFFEWLTMQGSSDIIGRMEITLADSKDPIGVNCQQCCSQVPFGLVVPGEVTLTSPGQLKNFETDIKYNTCSGQTGPFYLPPDNLDFSAPFSWTSKKVSASSGAEDDLSFTGTANGVRWDCAQANFLVLGEGKVKGCLLHLASPCCKNNLCSPAAPAPNCSEQAKEGNRHCLNCKCCCDARFDYQVCENDPDAGDDKAVCVIACHADGACQGAA